MTFLGEKSYDSNLTSLGEKEEILFLSNCCCRFAEQTLPKLPFRLIKEMGIFCLLTTYICDDLVLFIQMPGGMKD